MSSRLGGLSYGVLKEQEFGFRSKLAHTAIPSRSRAYSLPSSNNTHHQQHYVASSSDGAGSGNQQELNSRSKRNHNNYHDGRRVNNHEVSTATTLEQTNYTNIASYNHNVYNASSYNHTQQSRSSCPLDTIREESVSAKQCQQHCYPYLSSTSQAFVKQQQASFISGDPHSDRLAEFVSRMVYSIFWSGSDSFNNILNNRASFKDIFELYSVSSVQPSNDFMCYTRYLLQTMQVSCSTALLSLFYLHRLRPRVKHLFVDGTFRDCPVGGLPSPSHSTRYQYKRDSRLEYRLFTVALILANKYLDDNSYSNKAWSEITGLELRKINVMELEFMKYIDYSLLVKERDYILWVRWLEAFIRIVFKHQQHQQDFEISSSRRNFMKTNNNNNNNSNLHFNSFPVTPKSSRKDQPLDTVNVSPSLRFHQTPISTNSNRRMSLPNNNRRSNFNYGYY